MFCESVVFTEVRRRSRVLNVDGGRDCSSVTEVTSKVLAEAVLIEVTERLRGYLARGRVYIRVTEGQVQLQTWSDLVVKSCVELLHLSGINILVVFSDIPVF